jgi:hypothetical protein
MLEKTLDGMASSPLFDQTDGGFFRYSPAPDWSEAQHEKMLEDNVGLARIYLDAHLLLGKCRYRDIAARTIDFLIVNLYDPEARGFRGSQGAHSDYFGLPSAARSGQTRPPVDPFCYSNWSAQAVSLLLHAAARLPRPRLKVIALSLLDHLDAMAQTGSLSHAYNSSGPGESAECQLLTDWAQLLNALMDANGYAGTGELYLPRARAAAAMLVGQFYDAANGGFFDVASNPDAVGYLRVREKPLPENVAAAQGLMKLHQATGEAPYLEAARRTLSAFVEANRIYGEFAAGYALTLDLLLHQPVEIAIEGHLENPDTLELLRAAARVTYANLVIKLIEAPLENQAQAQVCRNTVCLPPVSDPTDLALTVAEAVNPQASPFEDVFRHFGSH